MPKTLLAVDDSATMRKVLEITFSGEDFKVITAEGRDAALAKLAEEPKVVLIDTALGSGEGYALCEEIRKRDPRVTLVLLASRYNPYDQAKGKEAGADDFMDKPFDTQQAIDKVRKALLAREVGAPLQAAAPAQPVIAAAPIKSRSATLMFDSQVPPPKPMANVHAPPPAAAAKPTPAARPPVEARPAAHAAQSAPTPALGTLAAPSPHAVATAVNGQLAGKLGDLGLSAQQAEAVMALSREVVERVVWEIVPQLAETLIREEIARLTKEG